MIIINTLGKDGHTKGVNCISYYHGGEKPYLVSGSDDKYES